MTIINVPYRLSTLASCDRIYRLSNNKIVDQGGYKEVIGWIL